MERSSASVVLGNLSVPFRLSAGVGGGSFLRGFPSGEVARQFLRGDFPSVVRPRRDSWLWSISSSEMVFTSPCGPPPIGRNGFDAPLPQPLALVRLHRVRAARNRFSRIVLT
jgi:hypothetical protein